MSDFLPHDVFIDVLTRLPIKALVRCACVCKSWYSLFTNPSFITTHLNRSSIVNNNNNFLLVRSRSVDDWKVVHYSLLRSENGMLCDNAELELPLKCHRNPFLRIIGCYNGLVCLSNDLHGYREELFLWNPSIRKTMALHPLRVKFRSHGPFMHTIGFGFDSATDDYKVIRIVYSWQPNAFKPPEIDIFNLSTGTWRNISHLGLPHIIDERAPQTSLNGAAHWFVNGLLLGNACHLIVSFHMGDEVFGEIKVPSSICDEHGASSVRVDKYQESLSLITGIWGEKTCCIWVMTEYGMPESWTKKFNIDMSAALSTSVAGFTRKGEIVLGKKDGCLVAYDPEKGQLMDLHIRGSTDPCTLDSFYADAYAESLVLLGATVTCEESPVLPGEVNRARKSRKRRSKLGIIWLCLSKRRRAKPKKKRKKRAVIGGKSK